MHLAQSGMDRGLARTHIDRTHIDTRRPRLFVNDRTCARRRGSKPERIPQGVEVSTARVETAARIDASANSSGDRLAIQHSRALAPIVHFKMLRLSLELAQRLDVVSGDEQPVLELAVGLQLYEVAHERYRVL